MYLSKLAKVLTYRATVDLPVRFRKSKAVGAVFVLTPSKYQSGEIDRSGRISRCGDDMMRMMLYEAAQSMFHSTKWSWLKAWAMKVARHRGMKKAMSASGRLLVIDETEMPTSVCTLIPSLLKGDELVAQVDECHRITLGGDKASRAIAFDLKTLKECYSFTNTIHFYSFVFNCATWAGPHPVSTGQVA